jgi:hypothetical protein
MFNTNLLIYGPIWWSIKNYGYEQYIKMVTSKYRQ